MERSLPPRSAAKRAAVLDAAQTCFLEKGYAKASIDDIAARAGVSKATIYAHFKSKDDLFGAIIHRRCDDQADGLGCLDIGEADDARPVLEAIARRIVALFAEPAVIEIYRMVVAEAPRHPELARIYYEAGPLAGKARLADALDQLKARGLLHHDDSWMLADMFVNMLRGEPFHRTLLGLPANPNLPPDAVIRTAVRCVMGAGTKCISD